VSIKSATSGTWKLHAQTATQTLSEFGIDAQTTLQEKAAYGSDIEASDFTLAINVWGSFSQSRHPYASFSDVFGEGRARVGNFDPSAVEVPYPIGEPAGELRTVDVESKIEQLGSASPDEQGALIEELAWIYNQALPRLPLLVPVSQAWLTTDDWEVPPKASEWMRKNGPRNLISTGRIRAKSGSDVDTFTIPTRLSNPTDMQWNRYFAQSGGRKPVWPTFEQLATTGAPPVDVDAEHAEPTPILAESIDHGAGTVTLTIRGDRVWTDGDPVTAEDVATQFRLEQHLGQGTGGVWDAITVRDETTLEFDVGDRNPELAESLLLPTMIETKRDSQYGDWVERFESAADESERDAVREDVVQTRIEETPTYGLWTVESISDSRVVYSIHDDHPRADDVNVDRLEMPAIPKNQKRWQSLQKGLIDGLFGSGMPESVVESQPDHALRLPYAGTAGAGIVFNHGRTPFDDYRVRKAIAYLVNRRTNATNGLDFLEVIQWPTGLPNQEAKTHLGHRIDDYETYGYEASEPEAAARLLREAGFTKR
jgi:ABC-type transport system substrate-binding protein